MHMEVKGLISVYKTELCQEYQILSDPIQILLKHLDAFPDEKLVG